MTRVSAAEIKRVSVTVLTFFISDMVDRNSHYLYVRIESGLDVIVVRIWSCLLLDRFYKLFWR